LIQIKDSSLGFRYPDFKREERAMSEWYPQLDRILCTGCGDCVSACPTGALAQVGGKAALAFPDLCTYCAACEAICSVNAIALPYLICRLEDIHEQAC
jgi:ferredoxin